MCVRNEKMVPPARFQRATFRLGGGRSMQLSYGSLKGKNTGNRRQETEDRSKAHYGLLYSDYCLLHYD